MRERTTALLADGKTCPYNELWTRDHDTACDLGAQRPSGVRTPAQVSRTCW